MELELSFTLVDTAEYEELKNRAETADVFKSAAQFLVERRNQLVSENTSLTCTVQDYRDETVSLQQEAAARDAKIQEYLGTIDDAEFIGPDDMTPFARLLAIAEDRKVELARTKRDLDEADFEITELERANDDLEQQRDDLEDKVAALEAQRETTVKGLLELKSELETATNLLKENETNLLELKKSCLAVVDGYVSMTKLKEYYEQLARTAIAALAAK